MTDKFYVYTITSVESGEVFYVGKGSGYRWKQSLKRIEELSGSTCEVFIENVDSSELALQRETKLIRSLSPVHNKRVSWRKLKAGSSLTKLSVTVPFELDLVSITKTTAGFNYELVQIGDNLFKLLITKSGEGFKTAEFNLSTKRDGILRITTNGTGVTEPSKASAVEHKLVYEYIIAALSSVQNSLNTLGYEFTLDNTKAEYGEVRFGFESNPIYGTEKVLDYFTGICGRVEHSKSRALGVARNLGFQYKSFYSKNSNVPCGITFSKMSGTTNVYHLTMYRKDLEIKDRAERKKATPFELGSLEMVKDRLRVEGHVLPQTFYRGRCKPFRDIFLGVGGGEGKPQKYWSSVQFLTDSEATVEKLKRCMAEMAYQLGIHLIFSAWSLDFVRGKIEGLVEKDAEKEIFDKWCAHEDTSTKNFESRTMKEAARKFAAKVEKLMGFNPCFVPATTFLWIQKGLYMSQLTEKEHTELIELETSRKTGSAKYAQIIDSAIDRAKDCRKSLREIRKGFLEFGEEPIGVVA